MLLFSVVMGYSMGLSTPFFCFLFVLLHCFSSRNGSVETVAAREYGRGRGEPQHLKQPPAINNN